MAVIKGLNFFDLKRLNEELSKVKQCFPELKFKYQQYRGGKTKSFIHEAWVLYNLIEVFEPQKVFGLYNIENEQIGWEENLFLPVRYYRWGVSGKEGPKKVIESVIPGIKILRKNGDIVYLGYRNSFFGYRPCFSIYLGFKEIRLKSNENRIKVMFDNEIMTEIDKKMEKDSIIWDIEKYNFMPDIIIELGGNKRTVISKIRGNIEIYRQKFPNAHIIMVSPEYVEQSKLQGYTFVLDTYNKKLLLEEGKCDKKKFQERLRDVIFKR